MVVMGLGLGGRGRRATGSGLDLADLQAGNAMPVPAGTAVLLGAACGLLAKRRQARLLQ